MSATSGQTTVECPRCGTRSAGAAWCTKCGRRLPDAGSHATSGEPFAPEGEAAPTAAAWNAAPPTAEMPPAGPAAPTMSAPTPPSVPAHPAPPAWQEPPDRRNLYLALAAAAIAAIVLLVVLLGKGGGSSSPTTPQAFLQSTPTPEQTTPSTPEPTPVSAESVEQVLSEYQEDYSSENADGLRGLFSEQLARTDGSNPTEDLTQAIHTYEKQFSQLKEPSYTLSNIDVEPGTAEATAGADYSITSQNGTVTGSISFHFSEQENRLLIDSITVRPSK